MSPILTAVKYFGLYSITFSIIHWNASQRTVCLKKRTKEKNDHSCIS